MTPDKLKKIRLELNMGLHAFGEETGYSKQRLDSMERLGRPIPKELINKAKSILKKKIENLKKLVD